jgi:hypothetical protein
VEIVLTIHSWVRWVILLVAVIAIVKLSLGWLHGGTFDGMDRGVVAGYSGLLDLQALVGIILLVGDAVFLGEGFPMVRILHTIVMLLAVVAGHLPARWRQSPAPVRYRGTLAAISGAVVLILIGVIIITIGSAA